MRCSNRFLGFAITQVGVLAFLVVVQLGAVRANDDLPTASEVQELGLVVHWRAQTERTQLGTGQAGIAIWPHSKMRNQVITIKVGDRIVERIDANDIDLSAKEKLVYSSARGTATKRLGMDAARELADKTVARYAKIGKKAEKLEIDQPITYLVAASNDGAIQALNAETGELFWSNSVGNFRLPTLGPGVNDQFVTITNGMELFVLELTSGRLLGKCRLTESPSASPQPIGPLVYVPGIKGSLIAYEGEELDAAPISVRFTGTLTAPVVASHDGNFIAWPNKTHLYLAQTGRKFLLWSRVETGSTFLTMPQLIEDGFIAVATNGMVYRINQKRSESISWRENLAAQVSTPPLVARGLVMVVSDIGNGYALDASTGEVLWTSNVPDLSRILSITDKKVYAQRKAGQLVAIDRSNGKAIANLSRSFSQGVFNAVNDRIILRSLSGTLVCLREPDSVEPKLNLVPIKTEETADAKAMAKPATSDGLGEPATNPSSDPFGEPPKMELAPAAGDDPFNSAPSPVKPVDPNDPFGT